MTSRNSTVAIKYNFLNSLDRIYQFSSSERHILTTHKHAVTAPSWGRAASSVVAASEDSGVFGCDRTATPPICCLLTGWNDVPLPASRGPRPCRPGWATWWSVWGNAGRARRRTPPSGRRRSRVWCSARPAASQTHGGPARCGSPVGGDDNSSYLKVFLFLHLERSDLILLVTGWDVISEGIFLLNCSISKVS